MKSRHPGTSEYPWRPSRTRQLRLEITYESAMQNSKLPETQRFSQEMMSIADGAPTFYDLDIIDDRS